MREPDGPLLRQVGHVEAEGVAVTDGPIDFGGGVTDDDADILDPCVRDGLESLVEDGLVGYRQQLFGGGVGG